MRSSIAVGLLALLSACGAPAEFSEDEAGEVEPAGTSQQEIRASEINDSYLVAFGRQPTSAEINYWKNEPDHAVDKALDYHARWLSSTAGTQDRIDTIKRSIVTVFKRQASTCEINYWSSYLQSHNKLYRDLVRFHADFGRDNYYPRTGNFCFRQYTGIAFWTDCAYRTYDVPPC